MQSTYAGFQRLSPDAVFKVCDQPHPMLVTQVLKMCMARNFTEAVKIFHGADLYTSCVCTELNPRMACLTCAFTVWHELLPRLLSRAVSLMHAGLHVTQGYSSIDMVQTMFRVCKNLEMPEKLKLEYIREIGATHMRVAEGVDSLLQMNGLLARLSRVSSA